MAETSGIAMSWEGIIAIIAVVSFVGAILIYAAKSIFQTKQESETTKTGIERSINTVLKDINSKLYDQRGATNFVLRTDCEAHKKELDKRNDISQKQTCIKLEELKRELKISHGELVITYNRISSEVSNLTGRFDQYLTGEIKKENGQIDLLINRVTNLLNNAKG